MIKLKIKNKLIFAADLDNLDEVNNILNQISNLINTVKIGYPLVLSEGIECISKFKNLGYNVIADFKVADIPATNKKICKITFEKGADAIIVHGFVGKDSVKACKDIAKKMNKELFLVVDMSHPGSRQFLEKNSKEIAKIGLELGIKNYVLPSTKPKIGLEIRKILGDEAFVISPGIGVQGGEIKKTLKFADAIIVGRSIYQSKDPMTTTKKLINHINLAIS